MFYIFETWHMIWICKWVILHILCIYQSSSLKRSIVNYFCPTLLAYITFFSNDFAYLYNINHDFLILNVMILGLTEWQQEVKVISWKSLFVQLHPKNLLRIQVTRFIWDLRLKKWMDLKQCGQHIMRSMIYSKFY